MKFFLHKKRTFLFLFFVIFGMGFLLFQTSEQTPFISQKVNQDLNQNQGGPEDGQDPLSISYLRQKDYPGSEIIIEQELNPGSNYQQYIASYRSDGMKIYALLTVPQGQKPANGWPVIVFNHGYIQPSVYNTTERYENYVDTFARNGYIVFKSDYRGHGSSEGEERGGYGNNDYTIDVLNAVASIKKYSDADSSRIGMWGHSMGGGITLRSMVVSKDIKAGVIWAGVVGSYADLVTDWRRSAAMPAQSFGWRQDLIEKYGEPENNPSAWNAISSTSFLKDISGPLQVHHGTGDTHVPIILSEKLNKRMKEAGKETEFFTYEGDDHDISQNFSLAINRSVAFFDKILKN